jgi:hypothetical protein
MVAPQPAWGRFALICAGLFIVPLFAWAGTRRREPLVVAFGGLAGLGLAALTVLLLVANDWQASPPPWPLAGVEPALERLATRLPLGDAINANVAAAALLSLVAPAAATAFESRRTRSWLTSALVVVLAPTLLALVLANSRGAWLGLAAGAVVAIVFGKGSAGGLTRPAAATVVAAFMALGVLVFWAAVAFQPFGSLLGSVGAGGRPLGRADLWADMIALAADNPLSGTGLGAIMMAHASYVRLLHVGFISHAHNQYLQVLVESGWLALAGFLGMLAICGYALLRSPGGGRVYRGLALGGLAAFGVHGMVDAGLYASRLAPLALAPAAYAALVVGAMPHVSGRAYQGETLRAGPVVLIAVAAAGLSLLAPFVRAGIQASLGVMAQGKAELAVYHWPEWPIQDALRRPGGVDLSWAERRYQAALALDPRNSTALRRLGQSALSRGDYPAALRLLESAYLAAPTHRAGRQLLGEARAIAGNVDGAAALWRQLPLAEAQLDLREWWHDHLGEAEIVARLQAARAAAGK